jgi:hypothetical protein
MKKGPLPPVAALLSYALPSSFQWILIGEFIETTSLRCLLCLILSLIRCHEMDRLKRSLKEKTLPFLFFSFLFAREPIRHGLIPKYRRINHSFQRNASFKGSVLEAFCNILSQKYTKVHSETAKAHDSFEFHNGDQ